MSSLKEDLHRDACEMRETHISWVFLHETLVHKIKKPVSLGFLDFSTLALRKAACEAEVALNRRLAPDVYLGVAPITLNENGQHRVGGAGPEVDWAVVMRRLPDAARADTLLENELLTVAHIDRIAQRLATFHEAARCDAQTTEFGDPAHITENVRENFAQARASLLAELGESQAATLELTQLNFIQNHSALFGERMTAGRVRDGHGDLKLEHFYFEEASVLAVDCIEFNDRFRYGDVCCDLAFLAMDLCAHHRVDLAERLLATYAMASNDYQLYALIDFYQSYRACVRAKVAGMLAADESAAAPLRAQATHNARRHFLLALAEQHRSLQSPAVIAVGGVIASGKSTFADQLGPRLGGPIISSDRVRKHLAGVPPVTPLHEGLWQGSYTPEMSERVYAEVFRRARLVLNSGRPVILDCSFRSQSERQQARALAQEFQIPFWFVECHTDPSVCRARLLERSKAASVSDGRLELFEDFMRSWEPVTEFSTQEYLRLDTAQPLTHNLSIASTLLPVWPAKLRG